jgi:peptidoglycan hydrolase-like protein with peptidoglycan-binding domain
MAVVAATPAPAAIAAPTALAAPAAQPAMDPALVATAQRDLKALGYAAGKAGDMADPAFQHAILAFEKDQGLAEDGLTPTVVEKLKLMRAALLKSPAADQNRNAVFVYSNGVSTRQPAGLLIPPPQGLVSDAPANFMQPPKPGSQASYQFGRRVQDGSFKPVMTITCQAGKIAPAGIALGLADAIVVDCRGDGPNPLQWRSIYSVVLGVVARQETAAGARDLVAIRPFTGDWPSAARTGLDWALTHALEAPTPGAPVEWSSTGVAPHFEIRAGARLFGQEAGLSGKYAAQPCRRFEMVQSGSPAPHYPGLACQNAPGIWSLPGSNIQLAAPSGGIAARASTPTLRSAQN